MKIRAVDFVSYTVSDLKKGIEFYRDILGLKLTGTPGDSWAEFDAGNVAVVLGTWGYDDKNKGNGTGVAFGVDDIDATITHLKSKGVKIDGDVWVTPVCKGASFKDPDGNAIFIHQRKDGTAG